VDELLSNFAFNFSLCLYGMGFTTREHLLTPRQFGVPYSRPRYFLLAKREGLKWADQSEEAEVGGVKSVHQSEEAVVGAVKGVESAAGGIGSGDEVGSDG